MAMTSVVGGVQFDMRAALAGSRNLLAVSAALDQVERRALGTLRRRLPVEARRDIQQQYALPAGRINQDLKVRDTATGLRLVGVFRGIGLMNYGARQTKQGVSYAIFKGQRRVERGAFLARLRNGNTQAVKRVGKARLPIQTLYGPTAAQMLRKEGRPERLADFAFGLLGAEMDRLMAAALNQGAPAGAAN